MRFFKAERRTLASLAFGAVVLLGLSGLIATPIYDRLDGLSVDVLIMVRGLFDEPPPGGVASPVVVVAIDEATYQTPPFDGIPKVLWAPQISKVQDAVLDGGATVFAYDLIFPTSTEGFVPGLEKPLLRSLAKAARQNRLLLGKVQHSAHPILPNRMQQIVAGGERNIRALNLPNDKDDVIRRMPIGFRKPGGDWETAFALEVASRHLKAPVSYREDGAVLLGGKGLSNDTGQLPIINFRSRSIPTYSLADLFACAERGDSAYFRRHFAGKAVFFGGVLDIEDRKLTSYRLVDGNRLGARASPCSEQSGAPETRPRRDSLPGVYVHATATRNLVTGDALAAVNKTIAVVLVLGLAAFACFTALALKAIPGALLAILAMALFSGSAFAALGQQLVLPLVPAWVAMLIAYSLAVFYRYAIIDRQSRHIRRSFEHYVSPNVVQQLIDDPSQLKLSGKYFETTVIFTDLVGFTTLAERLDPMELHRLLTEYFSAMVDEMLIHEGTLDKFIGDAIMCFFGVPVPNADHPERAIATAWGMQQALCQMNERRAASGETQFGMRIGVNSGRVVAGNMGTETLFNYTIMGDCVNLAARLESANKMYGTSILVGESTRHVIGDQYGFRHIDRAAVKGKDQPVDIYELLGPASQVEPAVVQLTAAYEAALSDYFSGHFASACQAFEQLGSNYGDRASQVMAERCRAFEAIPPSQWNGAYRWDTK